MRAAEDDVILELDGIVRPTAVRERINDALMRTADALRDSDRVMTWEVIPLDLFGNVPAGVLSCWVFMLRASQDTGAERHPNSHQRSLSLIGDGVVQLRQGREWHSQTLSSDPAAPLGSRWASIPPDTWHRWRVGQKDWAVLSFHTVFAEDLIEERPAAPDDPDAGPTGQSRYQRS